MCLAHETLCCVGAFINREKEQEEKREMVVLCSSRNLEKEGEKKFYRQQNGKVALEQQNMFNMKKENKTSRLKTVMKQLWILK